MPAFTHDVVVVGAGPAGSIAALTLARAGHRVALLDRATFPRPKICGNCLNPRAWKIWGRLGLTESFRALPHTNLEGMEIQCEGRSIYRRDFHRRGPRAIERAVLDDWLMRQACAAGAEFMPSVKVTGIDAESGQVRTSAGLFCGRAILGADGRNSVVARQSGLMPPPQRCHRVGWQATLAAPQTLDRHVRMQIFEEGYFGYCRFNSDRAVVSLILDARRSQDPVAATRAYLPPLPEQEWLRLNPITRAPARTGRGRVWLAGDAARVVEPFTGEGVYFALSTGQLVGESIGQALPGDRLETGQAAYAGEHRALYRCRAWVNTLTRRALIDPGRTTRFLRHVRPPAPLVDFLSARVHAG